MDQLSSCYFCGTAVDASLGEYPVVPRELDPAPEHQTTIVLCSTCRRKLANVVGRIVDTVEERSSGREGEPAPSDSSPGGDDGPSASDAEAGAGDAFPPTPGGPGSPDSPDADGSEDDSPAGPGGEPADGADDPPDPGAPGEGTPREADAGEGDLLDSVSVSVLEYNKVMRLLENREFPVGRDEIEAVATSAYDLSPGEVNAVIDAAVERGLLREDEGELRRPT